MALEAVFKIGGQDFTPLLLEGGIKWSRNDIDGSNAGRTQDGVMHRDRVDSKAKLELSIRRVTTEQFMALNAALAPQYIDVTYLDPREGVVTRTFYGSSVSSSIMRVSGGKTYWTGTTFNLIER